MFLPPKLPKPLSDGGPFSLYRCLSTIANRVARNAYYIVLAAGVRVGALCTLSRTSFILKTLSEFLKAAGAPIVVLFVQSLSAVLLITIAIIAVAVLAERHMERQAARTGRLPDSAHSASIASEMTGS
jgi:hypothetical protein